MKHKFIYTKYALHSFRIIAIICALFLTISEIHNISIGKSILTIIRKTPIDYYSFFFRCLNFVSIALFIALSIFPRRIEFFSFITFVYAVSIIPFEPENYMGLLMFSLGTTTLLARGLLKKHRLIKFSLLIGVYCVLLLSHIRFGLHNFINYFVINIAGLLVQVLSIFFLQAYYINTIIFEDKRLNLAEYQSLNERDCTILKKIQENTKYSVIAREVGLSEGALKNRLHIVFDILETGDKQGFLSIYEDWEILYTTTEKATLEQNFHKLN